MSEISVIIPVYNVEKYLEKCLDSVVSQTFSDIEIICVNDGSTDNSRKILDEYAKKDNRIKIIDKKNGGLSSARNAGLKVAQGKYISFIDSDDWVEITMLEKLYNSMTTLNTDISICAVHQYDENIAICDDTNPYFNLSYFDSTFDNRDFSYEDTLPFIMDVCVMAWNKLYRKSFIDECGAEFPDGLIFEDGPFFFSIFFKTKRVSIVRDFLYFYRINRKGSIVQKGGKQFLDILDVVELMYNSIKELDCFNEIKNEFYIRKADDIIYRYDLVNLFYKHLFSNRIRKKKFLFDETVFDFDYIGAKAEFTFKNIFKIKHMGSEFAYHYHKFSIKMMYKVMQVLYTEEGIYYFKYRKLVLRLKKRANLYDVWYEDDKIHVVLFNKIKFGFKFEYSKLEKMKKYEKS